MSATIRRAGPRRLRLVLAALCLAPAVALPSAPAAARGRLGQEKAASGLKEALSVGTSRAVDVLGRVDGFLDNDEVRIEAPESLRHVDKALEMIGQGALVDEFVTSMNRAAEAAVPVAKEEFLTAIRDMSFQDAVTIVKGTKHEATDYLEEHSRERLQELFRPIVAGKLEEVGATAAFNRLVGRYAALPFGAKPVFDLEGHVTGKALDGLFLMVAKEEERIRTDVVARTTDLLREVFAQSGDGAKPKKWWEKVAGDGG